MAGRKIRDAEDALACLAAAARSGAGRAAWARSRGIDGRSLNAWRMNLGRGGHSEGPSEMVELIPIGSVPSRPTYRVRCGDFVVEVDGDFDDVDLQRLLSVVTLAC